MGEFRVNFIKYFHPKANIFTQLDYQLVTFIGVICRHMVAYIIDCS